MHLSAGLFGLLAAAGSGAASPEDIFRRAGAKKPVIEKRVPHQPFQNERLEKRASRFRTDKTENFVVDG